jgi:hypothetical protein
VKKLLELEEKLKKARAELASLEKAKDKEDEKEDKKMIEKEMDDHNEDKHDEPKDEDSAMKKNVNMAYSNQSNQSDQVVKFAKNGQWSMVKADQKLKADKQSAFDAHDAATEDFGSTSLTDVPSEKRKVGVKTPPVKPDSVKKKLKKDEDGVKYPSAKDLEHPDSPELREREAKEKQKQVEMPSRKNFSSGPKFK